MQVNPQEAGVAEATTRQRTVTRYGMTFTVLSSHQRSVSVEGRHFFCTGRDCDGWTLFEKDHDIAQGGAAKLIGRRFERLQDTKALVAEIQRLVASGDKLPTDVRPPWVIDKDRHEQCMRLFAATRLQALEHGETFIYHTLRWCGRVIREFNFTTVADEFDGEATQRMAHHFDARDLPEQYRQTGGPVDWIRSAIADGFQLSQIHTFRDDSAAAAQGGVV